jgi:hypothetical protein
MTDFTSSYNLTQAASGCALRMVAYGGDDAAGFGSCIALVIVVCFAAAAGEKGVILYQRLMLLAAGPAVT